jgi:hypothetical protein
MATSEIEKLERRYAENPHGLTFAPLAEVHRKNGDIPRALELLRIGLELHPNYIPASIVLGRCQQDLGDLPAAEEAFGHVLRLDDENVIALKSLADINERQDKLEEAERWLRRLVTVDRSNEEARQQLEQIEALKEQARKRAPSPPAVPEELPHEIAVAEGTSSSTPPLAETGKTPAAPELPESLDLTDEIAASAALTPAPAEPSPLLESRSFPPAPLQQDAPSPAAEPPPSEEAAPLPGLVSAEFVPPKIAPEPLTPLGLEIETEEDVILRSSGASEFTVPDASQDFMALAAQLNASRPRNPGRRAADRKAEGREPEARAPEPTVTQPAPSQAKTPEIVSRSYAARDTKGQSIAAFFQSLLRARPPGQPGASDQPSRIAAGNSGSPHQEVSQPTNDASVSFDDFFGATPTDSSAVAGSEPGNDDLDQFHSWLQNLKR